MKSSAVVSALLVFFSLPSTCRGSGEDLQDRIWALKCENGFQEAVSVSRELLDLQTAEGAESYYLAYASVQLKLLEHIVTLGPGAQAELADAYLKNGDIAAAHADADYALGAQLCREQYDVFVRYLGKESLDSVYILGGMAYFAEMLGDYKSAMSLYRDCLAGMRALLGDEHPQVAMHLNNLAALQTDLGNYEMAGELMREALDLRSRALGPDDPLVAQSINNLAVLSKRSGDNLQAEVLYRKALSIYRKAEGPSSVHAARTLNNLGVLLYDQHDWIGAKEKLEEALELRKKYLGERHADVAVSLVNVAKLRADQGDFDEAKRLFQQAMSIRRETYGDPHPKIADTYAEMAEVYAQNGDPYEAERLIQSALKMWESFFGHRHPKIAEGLLELARIQELLNHFDDAIEQYEHCLDVIESESGSIHPRAVDARTGLAGLLQRKGRYREAREQLEQAAEEYELARVRAGSALHRDWVMPSPYPRLAVARLLDREGESAWMAQEAGLSRKLSDLVLDLQLRPLSKEQRLRQAELLRAMERAEKKLDALRKYEQGSPEEQGQYQAIREELSKAELAWSAVQAEVADQNPVMAGRPASLKAIQAGLDPETAMIGWVDVDFSDDDGFSSAYVVRSKGAVAWVPLERDGALEAFKGNLLVAGSWPFRLGPDEELNDLARAVYRSRLAPLGEYLEGVKRLIVIPSGAMRGVPVEALQNDRGRAIADAYTVSYVPSATIYHWLINQPRSNRATSSRALLVGDPVFKTGPTQQAAQAEAEVVVFRSALSGNHNAMKRLPSLPGTRDEVLRLVDYFDHTLTLLGTEATESRIMDLAGRSELEQFNVLHLATHALVDSEQPARSALVLSSSDLPDPVGLALKGLPIDDGLLTVREILAECRMDADLVTLSACRTASTGPDFNQDYLGLAPAFLQAGARNLLVSLWPVDDRATVELMARFYSNLQGGRIKSKSAALAEAKHWLRGYREPDGSAPFAHPVYWAGFILLGTGI